MVKDLAEESMSEHDSFSLVMKYITAWFWEAVVVLFSCCYEECCMSFRELLYSFREVSLVHVSQKVLVCCVI